MWGESWVEKGWVPDFLIRAKIRSLLRERLKKEENSSEDAFVRLIGKQPIAVETLTANDQHYEVPAPFFELVLGRRLKYSCGFYEKDARSLNEAEEHMIALSAQRAGLSDGMDILELGCGWGSLSLWMAQHYPKAHITAVSNSQGQRKYIEDRARDTGLNNIRVVTCDMNVFGTYDRYDRVVSVEMFEHMRNIPALLKKISGFMKESAKLFVHIFTHARHSYLFENKDDSDWMARHFFSGGMMPSKSLYHRFQEDLSLISEWNVNGINYQKTANAWLQNLDRRQEEVLKIFSTTYGNEAKLWIARWRVFFMACSELWGFAEGKEWSVSHYLFEKSRSS